MKGWCDMNTTITDTVATDYSDRIRAALGNRVRDIILFGSRARGDNKEYSDYDMLLIVDKRDKILRDIVVDIEVGILDTHERLVGSIVYESAEWERKKRSPLGRNIQREGMRLF
jgi:predicted nucleotidyltransferase